jgi:hypothetical protein
MAHDLVLILQEAGKMLCRCHRLICKVVPELTSEHFLLSMQ